MYHYTPKYCDAFSILLVSSTGALRRLYCPFRVVCMESIGQFKVGMHLWVAEVLSDTKGILTYVIFDTNYAYHHFHLSI